MLRELNLYPQWVRRNQPAPVAEEQAAVEIPVEAKTPQLDKPAPVAVVVPEAPVEAMPKTVESPVKSPLVESTPEADKLSWPQLKQQVRDCTACKLRAGCTQTVFGIGDEQADWLFVGEGPGADEDALGEPFVGEAGKLLDNMLMAIQLKRGRNVYIANVVKCRPPENHNPASEEISACLPYLQRQIELVQPKLIVALGKVASNALLGKDATLASLRGIQHDYHGIPLVVTYHPAYLLRSPSEKVKAWQDLCLALKMRGGDA